MALTLHYDFDTDKALTAQVGPTLTCARASEATYFDSSGVLQTAANNVARFDHDPSASNASLGLLVEEARTNLCTYSEDFTHANWTETNTDQPSSATSPDGTSTADEIAATSTADQAFGIYQAFTGRTAAQATTVTCYLKAGTNATFAQLVYDADGGGTDGFFCNFKLSDGTKGTVTAFAGGTATSSAIEDVGNGWYRCSITGSIAVGTVARFTIAITDIITAAGFEAANLADNDSIFAWGGSVEIGAFPTSYIPTVAASVTRAKDQITSSDLTWYNATEGSVYTHANTFDAAGECGIFSLNDSTTHRYYLYAFNDDVRAVIVSPGTNGILLSTANEYASEAFVRSSLGLAANDMAVYGDGTLVGTTASVDMPTPVTFAVGSFLGSNHLNGHIKEIRYYNESLADSVLEDMSNGTFPSTTTPGGTGLSLALALKL